MPFERRLVSIMFTDIEGLTSIMSQDESKAIGIHKKKESILQTLLKEHNGTYIKSTGDGSLSCFHSTLDAVTCAKRLQESIYDDKELNVRIGIHCSDTIFEDGDIRGDGVNIAARLENMGVAGGIFISKQVYDQLGNQKDFDGVSLGLQSLKGVGRLIEVIGLKGDKLIAPNTEDYRNTAIQVHKHDEVPSIAIIPFDNKGADEDVFYAYGISSDLISDVTSAGLIRVAGLKQVEELGDISVEEKAKKLFVRYIVHGTLWKMGKMFQLSVELYDTKALKVVWSDRWQEKWENLPAIKGNLSDGLLKAFNAKPKIEKKVVSINTQAYEYYLKAKYKYDKRQNIEDTTVARGLLNKAIDLDDKLLIAKNILGTSYREMGDYDRAMEIYVDILKQAEVYADMSGIGLSLFSIGIIYWNKGDYENALNYFSRSLKIRKEVGDKSGVGESLHKIGLVYNNKGDYGNALNYFSHSLVIREEVGDKMGIVESLINIGNVYANKGDYNKAPIRWVLNALDYHTRSQKIIKELGDKSGMGMNLGNIGIVYENKGDYDKALDYHTRSLKIREEIGDKLGIGMSLYNIANVYLNKGVYDKALDFYTRSLKIREELGDKLGMGDSFNNIGLVYLKKGDYNKALDYHTHSLKIREASITCTFYIGAIVLIYKRF